ncbi:hypothetical protein SAMN05660284_02110 [Formivibrio citricus]|uniref:Uncharacterized protein n=1 Tax=Formivibrio citricus TaxID=83765 RepID=A0A1I5BA52_9NEIS|nr:hypothetical protein [Formivibrio citricus]SFN71411.1 hypothetical protein SAMN05660284_02110 [Formivibrio citricus]
MHKNHPLLIASVLGVLFSATAFANDPATTETQRNINQQQRIEQGLKSGQLTPREAARLEGEQARIERTEAKAMKDGTVTPEEQRRINAMQNKASRDIYREKHDAQTANPNNPASRRMAADVQRNVNQQQRINAGVKNGSLTHREAAGLEARQARINRMERQAGKDGRINAAEQRRIQKAENQQNRRIYRKKHNASVAAQ